MFIKLHVDSEEILLNLDRVSMFEGDKSDDTEVTVAHLADGDSIDLDESLNVIAMLIDAKNI